MILLDRKCNQCIEQGLKALNHAIRWAGGNPARFVIAKKAGIGHRSWLLFASLSLASTAYEPRPVKLEEEKSAAHCPPKLLPGVEAAPDHVWESFHVKNSLPLCQAGSPGGGHGKRLRPVWNVECVDVWRRHTAAIKG